jgi:hypothetical protein
VPRVPDAVEEAMGALDQPFDPASSPRKSTLRSGVTTSRGVQAFRETRLAKSYR